MASKHHLQPQYSVTLLDSAPTSNVSLIEEDKQDMEQEATDTGKLKQPRQKTLAEIDRYTLCNKEIVVFWWRPVESLRNEDNYNLLYYFEYGLGFFVLSFVTNIIKL